MSKAALLAQKSKLYIAGSSGDAVVLTAVTAGYPTVLAITGHTGLANGDVVTLSGFSGANAAVLNGMVAVVRNYATGATNDTFVVDINTVGKTVTIAANTTKATPATWTQVKEVKRIGKSGAKASSIDVTDLDSDAKEFRTGLIDNGEVAIDLHDLPGDPGQQAMLAAFTASSTNSFKVVLTGGSTRTFDGSVTGFDTTPDAAVDGVQTIAASIKISGAVTRS